MAREPFPAEILASPTGARLNLHYRAPERDERGVVQINHGLAEHADRYARFAGFLARHGFHVYAHDHRGHGRTSAPDAPRGRFAATNGTAKVIADVAAVHELIAEQHEGLPVVIFGHAMGAQIALDYLSLHPRSVAGAAIWNADISAGASAQAERLLLRAERMMLGSDVPSRVMPRLTFRSWASAIGNAETPFDWLSHDEAEVAAYIADPDCGWDPTVGMWRSLLDFAFHGANDGNLSKISRALPFNLVGGSEDPSTSGGRAVQTLAARLDAAGFLDVEMRIYSGMRHESLNEIGRATVMEDFARWAERVTAGAR